MVTPQQYHKSCLSDTPLAPGEKILLAERLPGGNEVDLLTELKRDDQDMTVVSLIGATDLKTEKPCIRQGGDDYLSKSAQTDELINTIERVLNKRRLTINNHCHQKQIEQTTFQIKLINELTMKMNNAYLDMTELDEILQTILVGITAEEGLRFNRAFLAMFDDQQQVLTGRLAIGPDRKEEGDRIWRDIKNEELDFHNLLDNIKKHSFTNDIEVNRIVQAFSISTEDSDHILIRAAREKKSVNVVKGRSEWQVPPELIGLLQEESFVIVPLYSSRRSLGVIIADHFVTGEEITPLQISSLENFASQASLAIEHYHLHTSMEEKIRELEKQQAMLVEAERYSAVGQVAAQLAHSIRNPITAIGGTARLLAKKTDDPEQLKLFKMMVREAEKIEDTLEDIFNFISDIQLKKKETLISSLLENSLILFYPAMEQRAIKYELQMPGTELPIHVDPDLIQQALVHLIRNGIEAMPDGGRLSIRVSQDKNDKTTEIIIQDTGLGIKDSTLLFATDPFVTTKISGVGMGLTIVKRIIKDHGGELQIQQRISGGTRVIISLTGSQAL
jgi:signal transduction histidine kinase